MHALYDLKAKLVEELEKYGKKDLDRSSLETVDTLAHAAKNICKVIEACEDEDYSERMSRRSYRSSYDDGMSRRDRWGVERGRSYSSDTAHKLEEMMEGADERTRRAIQQALQTIRG